MAVGNVQEASKNSSERNASRGEVFIKVSTVALSAVRTGLSSERRRSAGIKAISSWKVSGGFDTAAIAATQPPAHV